MGSNQQRQAVPLVNPEAPIVGTGLEGVVARNSGQVVLAEDDGEVVHAEANELVVSYAKVKKTYRPLHFVRSNEGTSINQKIVVRVGDKTNHNRLRMIIETDGTISPREALEQSITIMIEQLKAMVDIPSNDSIELPSVSAAHVSVEDTVTTDEKKEDMTDIMKTRIDTLELSTRTLNALTDAGIRTVGGIARKKKEDLLEIEGIGEKGIQEIRRALSNFGITLK
jgi:DNA-directed RNA polymerase alpha subunit